MRKDEEISVVAGRRHRKLFWEEKNEGTFKFPVQVGGIGREGGVKTRKGREGGGLRWIIWTCIRGLYWHLRTEWTWAVCRLGTECILSWRLNLGTLEVIAVKWNHCKLDRRRHHWYNFVISSFDFTLKYEKCKLIRLHMYTKFKTYLFLLTALQ